MPLSLSTRVLAEGPERLGLGAERARALGFASVHAARPPKDAAKARETLVRLGLSLSSLEAPVPERMDAIEEVMALAAAPAALLKRPLIVLDLQALVPGPRESAEGAIVRLSRILHGLYARWPGLWVAIRAAHRPGRLLGHRETEWLLSDNPGKPLGLWLDPARALALHRADAGPPPLDGADRFAARVLGVSIHGLGDGPGHAPPLETGLDWGTLRGLLPTHAPRVLDVGPSMADGDLVDVRREFEEVLGY